MSCNQICCNDLHLTAHIMTLEDNHEAKFFLLLSFDEGTDAKAIIENHLLPYIVRVFKLYGNSPSGLYYFNIYLYV
jgi:hypothetical protein